MAQPVPDRADQAAENGPPSLPRFAPYQRFRKPAQHVEAHETSVLVLNHPRAKTYENMDLEVAGRPYASYGLNGLSCLVVRFTV